MTSKESLITTTGKKCFVALFVFLLVSSCCNFRKEKSKELSSNSENTLLYCEKEVGLIHENLSEETLILNIDSIQSLEDLSNIVKVYYDVDCRYPVIKKVGLTFTHTIDSFGLGGVRSDRYVAFRLRNVCMSEPIHPEPLRNVYHYMLIADEKGSFINQTTPLKSESEILATTFEKYFHNECVSDVTKRCLIFMIEDLSIESLKSILNKTINAYLIKVNEYSKEQYLKPICDLSPSEYKSLSQNNKLNIEIDMCSGAKRTPPPRLQYDGSFASCIKQNKQHSDDLRNNKEALRQSEPSKKILSNQLDSVKVSYWKASDANKYYFYYAKGHYRLEVSILVLKRKLSLLKI